jgi:hypothetical protein
MALRPQPRRSYYRQRRGGEAQAERQGQEQVDTVVDASAQRQVAGLPREVLARVRAELGQEQARHRWRKAWSRRQQRAQHAES